MSSIKGYPIEGRREDLETDNKLQAKHATVTPAGQTRRALDTSSGGFYEVTASVAVETGSTSSNVTITGHSIKKGDLLRILTTANGIEEEEVFVDEVINANNVKLAGDLSADLANGDTIAIYRYVSKKLGSDGSDTSTLIAPPIEINVTSAGTTAATTVLDDQDNPTNTVPIPVRLFGTSGSLSVTSNELNVQLSHSGGTPDSVRIGDGTEILAINASQEAQVRDDDANTTLTSIDGKDFATQTTLAALLSAFNAEDFSSETTLAALSAKFNSLGQKANAASAPVTLSTEQEALLSTIAGDTTSLDGKDFATETTLDAIKTAVQLLDNIVNGSNQADVAIADIGAAASEATLSNIRSDTQSLDGKDFATETTLAAMSAKLPATLGQKTSANSLAVVLPSDQNVNVSGKTPVSFARVEYSSSNVTAAAYTEIISDTGATAGKEVIIFHANGEPIYLAIGAAASEVDQMIVIPGGFNHPVELSVPANSRLSVKALSNTITTGQIIINVLG